MEFYKKKDNIKTMYNYFDFNTTLQSYYKDSAKLNHLVDFDYYYLGGNYNNTEHHVDLHTYLTTFFGKELGCFDLLLDYNSLTASPNSDGSAAAPSLSLQQTTESSAILKMSPHIISKRKYLKAKVGLSAQVNSETGKFHFFPDAEFKYSLFNNIFIPYVGLGGGGRAKFTSKLFARESICNGGSSPEEHG